MGLGAGLGIAVAEGVGEPLGDGEPVGIALGAVLFELPELSELSERSAVVSDAQPLTNATSATPIRRLLGGSTPSP